MKQEFWYYFNKTETTRFLPCISPRPNYPSFSDIIDSNPWWPGHRACVPSHSLLAIYPPPSTSPCPWTLGFSFLSPFLSSDIFHNLSFCWSPWPFLWQLHQLPIFVCICDLFVYAMCGSPSLLRLENPVGLFRGIKIEIETTEYKKRWY